MHISKVLAGAPAADATAASEVSRQARSASAESEVKASLSPTVSVQRTDIRPKPALKLDPREMQQRLQEVVDEMNARMRESNRNLAFGVDSELNRFVIKVTSRTSGELVRQIPGEAVLAVAHSIEDLKGVLYEDFV
jgi:uncharacterized FlaG/YvyC family protein